MIAIQPATHEDDADLCQFLGRSAFGHNLKLSLDTRPSFFRATSVEGDRVDVVLARESTRNEVVGLGCRVEKSAFVNGEPMRIGYLGHLRIMPTHRSGLILARGFAQIRKFHDQGGARIYLTAVTEDSKTALALLRSGRCGLPESRDLGQLETCVIRVNALARQKGGGPKLAVRPATREDLPALIELMKRGGGRQFYPVYKEADLLGERDLLRDLRLEDYLLCEADGRLLGAMAGWDQRAFRRQVVRGYSTGLSLIRPCYNLAAPWLGRPRLPKPGEAVATILASPWLVPNNDPAVTRALLSALGRLVQQRSDVENVAIMVHERDPSCAALVDLPAVRIKSRLLACWYEDGEELAASLDERIPYLELGSL